MWARAVLVLLAAPACLAPYAGYQYEETEPNDDDTDFYDSDYAEDSTTVATTTDILTTDLEPLTRNRRYGRYDTIRTLNPEEIHDVKGLLNEILYGTKIDTLLASPALGIKNSYTDIYDYVTDRERPIKDFNETESEQNRGPSRNIIIRKRISTEASPRVVIQHWNPKVTAKHWSQEVTVEHWKPEATMGHWKPEATMGHWKPEGTMGHWKTEITGHARSGVTGQRWHPKTTTTQIDGMITVQHWITADDDSEYLITSTTEGEDSSTTTDANILQDDVQHFITIGENMPVLRTEKDDNSTAPNTTTTTTTTPKPTTTLEPTTTTTKKPKTTKAPLLDINAIIAIIANLTYDYEWNLTEQFNLTLIEHGVPTCPTPTTVTTTTTTPPPYDFSNTSVVSKCFVCGLKDEEIPRNAFCADAFAGDFLPLIPVDPRARGQIAKFRKYCRFLDVHNFVENPSESRSIYGRFTGGCGVRWTDLTGVYTQRTCRNRYKPLMGKHFASKRMAKLELALINVDNGCIISPMASLLPLSRGISLYARFHACVCTGNWCNKAIRIQQWKAYITILWYWISSRL